MTRAGTSARSSWSARASAHPPSHPRVVRFNSELLRLKGNDAAWTAARRASELRAARRAQEAAAKVRCCREVESTRANGRGPPAGRPVRLARELRARHQFGEDRVVHG